VFEVHKFRKRSSFCMRKFEWIFFQNDTCHFLGEVALSQVLRYLKADLRPEVATAHVTPLIGYLTITL
jgi:hypothetical protein